MKRYVAFGEMIADRWRGFVVQCYQLCEEKQTVGPGVDNSFPRARDTMLCSEVIAGTEALGFVVSQGQSVVSSAWGGKFME